MKVKVKDINEGEGEGSEGYFQPRLVSTGLDRVRGVLRGHQTFLPSGAAAPGHHIQFLENIRNRCDDNLFQ